MWQTGMPICLPFCSAVARWEPSSWCEQPRIDGTSVRSSRPSPNWIICSTWATSWPAQAHGSIEVPSEHERRARTAQVQLSWGCMHCPPLRKTRTLEVLPFGSLWCGCGSRSHLARRKPSESLCPARNIGPQAPGAAERGSGSLGMDPAECSAGRERRAGLASRTPLQFEVAD